MLSLLTAKRLEKRIGDLKSQKTTLDNENGQLKMEIEKYEMLTSHQTVTMDRLKTMRQTLTANMTDLRMSTEDVEYIEEQLDKNDGDDVGASLEPLEIEIPKSQWELKLENCQERLNELFEEILDRDRVIKDKRAQIEKLQVREGCFLCESWHVRAPHVLCDVCGAGIACLVGVFM